MEVIELQDALPAGTLVEKCNSGSNSRQPDGTRGHVASSFLVDPYVLGVLPGPPPVRFGYFVRWENRPEMLTFVVDHRLRAVKTP